MRLRTRFGLGIFVVVVASAACADENIEIVPDVVYGHKDGMAMTFDVFKPKKDANGAGILYMVSAGWNSIWKAPQELAGINACDDYKPLLDRGFTVFAVRHGSSPKYNIPAIVDMLLATDVACAQANTNGTQFAESHRGLAE